MPRMELLRWLWADRRPSLRYKTLHNTGGSIPCRCCALSTTFEATQRHCGDYATSPWHWAVAAAKRNAKKEKRKAHPELYARLWFRQPPPLAGSRRILVSGGTKTRTRPDVCGRAPTRRTVHRIRRRSSETTTGRNRIGHVAPSLRPAIVEKGGVSANLVRVSQRDSCGWAKSRAAVIDFAGNTSWGNSRSGPSASPARRPAGTPTRRPVGPPSCRLTGQPARRSTVLPPRRLADPPAGRFADLLSR